MSEVADANDVVRFLASGAAFGGVRPSRVDTHAAHVFLAGDRAWKLKRPVRYDYLDFSTPDLRRVALERELELNRRIAPALYLRLHSITRSAAGGFAIDGEGTPVDWLLEMRRFGDGDLLTQVARRGALTPELTQAIADRIVALHDAAAVVPGGGAARIERVIAGNAKALAAFPDVLDATTTMRLIVAQQRELELVRDLLDVRAAGGRVRRGHGDLHLGNIALVEGVPTPFDCLEFSDELATVDVLYDLAFLVMDLIRNGLPDMANLIGNRYVDCSGPDEDGWPLFPLFVSIRAAIRAHVRAAAGHEAGARFYLSLAEQVLADGPPALVAIGGRSGSGKSTIAKHLAASLGRPPGARILRSDVLRKRLAGVPPEARLPMTSYTVSAADTVYRTMIALAEQHLYRGDAVILDAAFLQESERAKAIGLADRTSALFAGLWLDADEATRIVRLETRAPDPSDATQEVASAQSAHSIGDLGHWSVLDVSGDLASTIDRAHGLIAATLNASERTSSV